ncbi:MAG: pyridoxamine 5'-phosphate oxidase [bacterium]
MNMNPNPFVFFTELYEQFALAGVPEPSAFTLATATPEGKPSARVLLLKEYDKEGFVFYTNLGSRKVKELQSNPQAALCFYWEAIHYQVRVEGRVTQIPDAEADAYFASRPRGSQIGAWASKQSAPLADRAELERRFREVEEQFHGRDIPRPPFWSGFRLLPEQFEFWLRQEDRLHERAVYIRENDGWKLQLLYP